jgi:chromate transport protein ChrA
MIELAIAGTLAESAGKRNLASSLLKTVSIACLALVGVPLVLIIVASQIGRSEESSGWLFAVLILVGLIAFTFLAFLITLGLIVQLYSYQMTQQRPLYIVKRVHNGKNQQA